MKKVKQTLGYHFVPLRFCEPSDMNLTDAIILSLSDPYKYS